MEYREYSAKSVDEAITQACLSLGVTSGHLDYEVVQEASGGFLGIGSRPAIIKARVKGEEKAPAAPAKDSAEAAAPASAEAPADDAASRIITSDEIEKRAAAAAAKAVSEGSAPAERRDSEDRPRRRDRDGRGRDRRSGRRSARSEESFEEVSFERHEPSKPKPERVVKERTEEEAAELRSAAGNFLGDVFKAMDITAEISTDYDAAEGAVNCVFSGDEMGLLIGKRGQTLDSLQYLTSLVVNKKTDEYVRVKLDTEDYRSRRADTLGNLARNIAYKVKKTRRPVALEPMNPYERRIIHSYLQKNGAVETYSEGDEPYRHVVVVPKR